MNETFESQRSVLVVDDTALYRSYARNILEEYDFTVYLAGSGEEALEMLNSITPSIILLDVIMGGIDGYETFRRILANPQTAHIPVVFLTGETDAGNELTGFKLGAADFISKPFVPEIMIHRIKRVVHEYELQQNLELQVAQKSAELQQITLQVISTIAATVDSRDRYTKGHSMRVAIICRELAKMLEFSIDRQTEIYTLGLLHDIGKISIPDLILNKPTKLTADEYDIIKKHSEIGSEILKNVSIIPGAHEAARWHHERYDGKGYPDGLSGNEIPLTARILALADAYDAMASKRPYRNVLSKDEIIKEFVKSKGSQFDPTLTDLMIQLIESGKIDHMEEDYPETHMGEYSLDSNLLLNRIYDEGLGKATQSIVLDSLTQTYSANYFEMQMTDALKGDHPQGYLIICNISGFHKVNDTYGTAVGDNLLVCLADAMRLKAGERDLVGRLAADEFGLYIYDDTKTDDDIRALVEAAMRDFEGEREILDYKNLCTISFGIARTNETNAHMGYDTFFLQARTAMASVKHNAESSYAFYEDIHAVNKNNATQVLTNKMNELCTYFEDRNNEMPAEDRLSSKEITFQLIRELATKEKQPISGLMVSIASDDKDLTAEDYLCYSEPLRNAIKLSLRHGDFDMQYDNTCYLIIITDVSEEDSDSIVERISGYFEKLAKDPTVSLVSAYREF